MKLWVNTSVPNYFVGLLDSSGAEIWQDTCPPDQKTSFWLPKALHQAKAAMGESKIDHAYIVDGPGSFTGLRVGFSALRAITYLEGNKFTKLTSLEALALSSSASSGTVFASVNAQRNRCFYQVFEKQGPSQVKAVSAPQLDDAENLTNHIPKNAVPIGFFPNQFLLSKPKTVQNLEFDNIDFSSASIYAKDRMTQGWEALVPNYFRKSSPEEKLNPN